MLKNLFVVFLFISVVQGAQERSDPDPRLSFKGPWLNFISAENDVWNVTALVVAPTSAVPSFKIGEEEVHAITITSMLNYDFLRYDLRFPREDCQSWALYSIGDKAFKVSVPPKGADPHVFFGSCNQYKKERSRQSWQRILQKHFESPFNLALLAGDQIYNDEQIFGIESVKRIMLENERSRKRAIVGEEKNSIEEDLKKVLLRHYLAHYSKCGFSDFLASVPAKCLADDHEYFNAVGSYPYHWPILQIIRSVADYFYYLFQHHTLKENAQEVGLIKWQAPIQQDDIPMAVDSALSQSWSYHLNFKSVSFYGLDTRSERTPDQIVTKEAIDLMMDRLESSSQENIVVITGIPLVYQNVNVIGKTIRILDRSRFLSSLFHTEFDAPAMIPLGLEADLIDPWSFYHYKMSRNHILQGLSRLAKSGKTVTLLGGDVHSASAGEVVDSQSHEVIIRQLSSSAITSDPITFLQRTCKQILATVQQSEIISPNLVQRLVGFTCLTTGQEANDINYYNWLDLAFKDSKLCPTLWTLKPNPLIKEEGELTPWVPKGWRPFLRVPVTSLRPIPFLFEGILNELGLSARAMSEGLEKLAAEFERRKMNASYHSKEKL